VLSYWYCVGDDCHVGRHDVIGLGSIDHRCSPSGHAVHTSASVIEVATLLEIETRLFDRLRGRPYYSRLKGVMIEPSQFLPRDGPRRSLAEFTVEEPAETAGIIRDLQKSLPLGQTGGDERDSGAQRAAGHSRSKINRPIVMSTSAIGRAAPHAQIRFAIKAAAYAMSAQVGNVSSHAPTIFRNTPQLTSERRLAALTPTIALVIV
jgi:hypothetical protein